MKRSTKKALRIATAAVAGFGLLIGYLSYRNAQIARELDSEGVTTSAVVIGRHTTTGGGRRPTGRSRASSTSLRSTARLIGTMCPGCPAAERSSAATACRSSMRRTTRRRTDSSAIRTVRSVGLPGRSAAVRSVSDIRKTPRESACRRICRRKASPSGSRQPVPAARASAGKKESGTLQKPGPRTVRECATERRPYRARAASETLQLNA